MKAEIIPKLFSQFSIDREKQAIQFTLKNLEIHLLNSPLNGEDRWALINRKLKNLIGQIQRLKLTEENLQTQK